MFGYIACSKNYVIDASNDTPDVLTTWSYDTVFLDTSLLILDDSFCKQYSQA